MDLPQSGAEKPVVTGSTHELPFERLSPFQFERLSMWLLQAEGFDRVEHFGAAGGDHGRDLVAYRGGDGDRPFVAQCKRRVSVGAAELEQDVAKILERANHDPRLMPRTIIFIVSSLVTAKTRDKVHDYCGDRGLECQFWALTELDAKVKKHSHILLEFFHAPWHEFSPTVPEPPHRIPHPPRKFVNRREDLKKLDQAIRPDDIAPTVLVLHGMHGVGKSAIGRQWAALNRNRFPGGDLFASFSRRDRSTSVPMEDVISQFLRDLGVEGASIPADYAARVEKFRNVTQTKKLLVLLDDVEFAAQVEPSMPTGTGSVVVVTSRRRLEELFQQGADSVDLQPFGPKEARKLLTRMVGKGRIQREPEAVDMLIDRCGGLPIALCLCAGRLVSDQARTVDWLVRRIDSEPTPFAAFNGLASSEIQAVFDFTYSDLAPESATLYRRLGGLPGANFLAEAAAALAGMPMVSAQRALDDLHRAHLMELAPHDRYRLHDLVRTHCTVCSQRDETDGERAGGLARLVDWYYAVLRNADRAVVGDRIRLSDDVVLTAEAVTTFDSRADAFDWFSLERPNVMGIIQTAFDHEWDERVWQIAETLWPLCASHKYFTEWLKSHQLAVASAVRLQDAAVEARFRSQLARAYSQRQEHQLAANEMAAAHRAAERCNDARLRASVTEFGGVCLLDAGDHRAALIEFQRAREMFQALGVMRGVALQDLYIGSALVMAARPDNALMSLSTALPELSAADDVISVGRVRVQRGEALLQLHRPAEAKVELEMAAAIMKGLGIKFEQAKAHELLARAANESDRPDVAQASLREAHTLYLQLGYAELAREVALLIEGELDHDRS